MVIDCETVTSNGCTSGSVQAALGSFATLGAYSKEQWPYTAVDTGDCHIFEKGKVPFNHLPKFALEQPGYKEIVSADRVALRRALRDGPVSFSFNSLPDFVSYTSGTYMGTNCDTTSNTVNHSMVAVGYDTDVAGNEYIIAKNSWGTSWGISGYANIYVNPAGYGTCGMFVEVNQATAGKGSALSNNMVDSKAILTPFAGTSQLDYALDSTTSGLFGNNNEFFNVEDYYTCLTWAEYYDKVQTSVGHADMTQSW